MMKKQHLILTLLSMALVFMACQKEYSFESSKNLSQGSLSLDGTGDCLPKTVVGTYEEALALDGEVNYIQVEVNVTMAGNYTISTDTVNGMFFRASGIFTTTGLQTVTLAGSGTPMAFGISNFVVTYSQSQCIVAVTILPVGGGEPAEITLDGDPNNCTNFQLEGTYVTGIPLNAGNRVILNVNALTIGTYNVSTTLSNGITFSAAGAFLTTGPNTIALTGNGTPLITGSTNIPITIGGSSCSFSVDVVGPAEYTIDCGSAQVNGVFVAGEELDNTHEVVIDVEVTTPGGYNITGTVNGMTFSAAGDFASAGTEQVTLIASGIPIADGSFDVPLTGGTASCSFPITVEEGAAPPTVTGTWKFTLEGTTYSGTISSVTVEDGTQPSTILVGIGGTNAEGDDFQLVFQDGNKTLAANETYSFTSFTGNAGMVFNFQSLDAGGAFMAAAMLPGVTLSLRTTASSQSSNPKTLTMTFSGAVLKNAGAAVPISDGQLSASYQ